MPLALQNNTPFACEKFALTAINGAGVLRIVLRGAFNAGMDGILRPAEQQPDIVLEDKYWGEPGESSIRYESDVVLDKPFTDIIVNGDVCTPKGRAETSQFASLHYDGRMIKRVQVFGDRKWRRGALGWQMTRPTPFSRLPLTYDRAYGGSDANGSEPRNRSGAGYSSSHGDAFDGTAAPNVEFPGQLIAGVSDHPAPAGFGVISRNWEPRLGYAGTYDNQWLADRFPLLPDDFDSRFFQSAARDQWVPRPRGGEHLAVDGMHPDGVVSFILPKVQVPIDLVYRDRRLETAMDLDTIIVEPNDRRAVLVWRTTADIHGDPFKLLDIVIGVATTRLKLKAS
jgi:hypothetical protein